MRILMVHNDYAKPSGEESAVRALAELLTGHGQEVLWHLKTSSGLADSFAAQAGAFLSGIHSFSARREMVKRLDEVGPLDIVQVQNLYPLLSPSILAPIRRRGLPIVMRCPNYRTFCPSGMHLSHDQVCEKCLGGREWWCVVKNCECGRFKSLGYALRCAWARRNRSVLDNVTVFMVLSEFQKRRYMAQGIAQERLEILPNFAEQVPASDDSSPGDWVSFVGRVSPEKGVDLFIQAARNMPEVPFVIAGDASRQPELAKDAPANVRFLGHQSRPQLAELYRRSRIVVVPSRCFEGFPNVIASAMAYAKPVVCSALGPLGEIVEDGKTGLTFQRDSAGDLAGKIRILMDSADLCRQMGQAGREKAQRLYSPEAAYRRLMEIYDKARLLSRRGPAGAAVE